MKPLYGDAKDIQMRAERHEQMVRETTPTDMSIAAEETGPPSLWLTRGNYNSTQAMSKVWHRKMNLLDVEYRRAAPRCDNKMAEGCVLGLLGEQDDVLIVSEFQKRHLGKRALARVDWFKFCPECGKNLIDVAGSSPAPAAVAG